MHNGSGELPRVHWQPRKLENEPGKNAHSMGKDGEGLSAGTTVSRERVGE